MNIKKSFLVALAAVTAVASVSALAVSASSLGESTDAQHIVVEKDVPTVVTAVLDGKVGNALKVKTELPVGAPEGEYYFFTALVADKEVEDAFDAVVKSDLKDVFEIGLMDAEGKGADEVAKNAKITFSTTKASAYNKVFALTDDGTFVDMGAVTAEDGLTFTNDGYTRFVLAAVYDEPISDPDISKESKPSTPSTPSTPTPSDPVTPTGDNTAATTAVFAVMGAVALGTVLATTKMKKTSK